MLKPFIKKTKKFINKTAQVLGDKLREAREPEDQFREVKLPKSPPKFEKRHMVDLSVPSVAKATLTIIALLLVVYALYYMRDILILFFISVFFATALDPFVSRMEEQRVPRGFGILVIYLLLIAVVGLLFALLIPILLTQIPRIAELLINTLNNLFPDVTIDTGFINATVVEIQQSLRNINIQEIDVRTLLTSAGTVVNETWRNALNIITAIGGGIFNVILIMVIVFFLLLDKKGLGSFFTSLFPSRYTAYIQEKAYAIQKKIGEWLVAQLLLCFAVGIATFIGLSILGVDYALTLALVAGITEFIPYLGPIIAGIPMILVALGQDGLWLAFWTFVVISIIQQLENNILVPLIMKRSVGLSPVATMFAMMIGYQVLGILGMILAVPIATSAGIFIEDYSHREK